MFKQTIFPEGYKYNEREYTEEELLKAIGTKEIVQGKLVHIDQNFNYGIIEFGFNLTGYINGRDLHDFNPKFAGCVLGNIINVHVKSFNEDKDKFVCSRAEILRDTRHYIDRNYRVGYTIKCKILHIDTYSMFAIIDIGNGVTVKVPIRDLGYNKDFKVNDFVDLTIRKCEKMHKHTLFALTIKKVGMIIPITFVYQKRGQWYGEVNSNPNYPLGKIVGLHQNALYESGDTHSATLIDYDDDNTPIYKLN